MKVTLPAGVLAMSARGDDWAAWVQGLPRLVAGLMDDWALTLDGAALHGNAALVLPVQDVDGAPAVLKVGWPHDEAEHEHLALQHWHGNGAVRLLRADPGRWAMVLERLDTTDLTDLWDLEACEIVAGLYQRLHVRAPPQLRLLTSYVERWNDDLVRLPRNAPVPRRLVEQAASLARDFVADEASHGTMIHTDLHYENVLGGDREPWLVIDPKPLSGDPHFEVAPLLWNRWDELEGDVRGGLRRRFHATVDAAGFDEHRARDWVVVRMVHQAVSEIVTMSPDHDRLTRCVAIAKAVQD